jgi:antitoxin ParD1/3/4
MPTMNISLTPELVELVNSKVTSGMYHSASEVIREGLRLLKEQDEISRIRLEELRREVATGTAQLERGEGSSYESGNQIASMVKAEARSRTVNRNKAEA